MTHLAQYQLSIVYCFCAKWVISRSGHSRLWLYKGRIYSFVEIDYCSLFCQLFCKNWTLEACQKSVSAFVLLFPIFPVETNIMHGSVFLTSFLLAHIFSANWKQCARFNSVWQLHQLHQIHSQSGIKCVNHRYRGEIPKLAAIFSRHGEQFGGIRFYSEKACVNCIFLRYERVFNRARKAATSATHITRNMYCAFPASFLGKIPNTPKLLPMPGKKFTWTVLKLWDLCLYICGVNNKVYVQMYIYLYLENRSLCTVA